MKSRWFKYVLGPSVGIVIALVAFIIYDAVRPPAEVRKVAALHNVSAWKLDRVGQLLDQAGANEIDDEEWNEIEEMTKDESKEIRFYAFSAAADLWGTKYETRAYDLLERMKTDGAKSNRDQYAFKSAVARHPLWKERILTALASPSKEERESAQLALDYEEKWVKRPK